MPGRGENGTKFPGFPQNILAAVAGDDLTVRQHLQPKCGLIRFFNYQPNLGDPFSSRSAPTSRPVIRRDRGPTTQQLLPDHLRISRMRQRAIQFNNPDRKLFCPLAQFLGPRGHEHRRVFKIYKITRLPNYKFPYRSISPSTISMLPIAATTSASSRPSHIFGSVCKFAKQADRMCTRYGLAVPSLTM